MAADKTNKTTTDCVVAIGEAAALFDQAGAMMAARDTEAAKHHACEGLDALRRGMRRLTDTAEYGEWSAEDCAWRQRRDNGQHDAPAPRLASFQCVPVSRALAKCATSIAELIVIPSSVQAEFASLLAEYLAPDAFDQDGASLIVPLMAACAGASATIKSPAAMRALNRKIAS